ncbi:DUF6406 domain-containing protein [Micromonospora sp. NPDC003197]
MRSFTNLVVIPNNVPMDLGPARLGVGWVTSEQPVSAEIIVMPTGSQDSHSFRVALGETFPVGDETWRFADVDFESADRWEVTVRRVDEDEPQDQPRGHLWVSARLSPYGKLDEQRLRMVEAELGQPLPPSYRRWLAENNGAAPASDHYVAGLPFTLMPERPLLGVHPQYPTFDLVSAQRMHRDTWLSRTYLVIAVPSGGLLVVKTDHPDGDSVWILPEDAMRGPLGAAGAADRERRLVYLAEDITYFIGRLQPVPELPPAQINYPDPDDPHRWDQP